ncbi:MAG: biotin/lipoyl-containing protein [Acidimicrobiales bacterium]
MSSLEIRLPALSATMEEATVLSWLVAPGDMVSEGQAIAEVSTDKVDMELESPYAGTIQELLVEEGATVPLGGAMATIESETDDLSAG